MSLDITDDKVPTSSNDIYNQSVDIMPQVKDENNKENNWTTSKLFTNSPNDQTDRDLLGTTFSGVGGTSLYNNFNFSATDLDDMESEEFDEDFEDVPPFDELPSVLYLTGDIDKKTLQKSLQLFQQKQLLKKFEEDHKSKLTEQEKNKVLLNKLTKNKNLVQTFGQPDTCVKDTFDFVTKKEQSEIGERIEKAELAKNVYQPGKQESGEAEQNIRSKEKLKDHSNSQNRAPAIDPTNLENEEPARDERKSEKKERGFNNSETKEEQYVIGEKIEKTELTKDIYLTRKQEYIEDRQYLQTENPTEMNDNSANGKPAKDLANSEKGELEKDLGQSENREKEKKNVKDLVNRKPAKDTESTGKIEPNRNEKFSEKTGPSEDRKAVEIEKNLKHLSRKENRQSVNNLQDWPIRESAIGTQKSNTGFVKNLLELDELKSTKDKKDDPKLKKSEEEQAEIEFIRRKRLEKLARPACEYEFLKTEEHARSRSPFYKDDNHEIIVKEGENMRNKIKTTQTSDKRLPDNKEKKQSAKTNDKAVDDDGGDDGAIPYAMRLFFAKQQSQKSMTTKVTKPRVYAPRSNSSEEFFSSDDAFDDEVLSDDFSDEDDELYNEERSMTEELLYKHKPTATEKQSDFRTPGKTVDNSQTLLFPTKKNKNASSQDLKDYNKISSNSTTEIALSSGKSQSLTGDNTSQSAPTQPKKPVPKDRNCVQNKNAKTEDKKLTAKSTKEQKHATPNAHPIRKSNVLKLKLTNIAEKRAKAFKSMKQGHYQMGIQCNSCGRPDCNSVHLQKMKETVQVAKAMGLEVRDVAPDGNCMFSAVVDQLQFYGDFNYNSKSLREAAVNWLIENPNSEDGTPFEQFLEEDWQTYLQRMLGEGQWGDHITLRAIIQVIGQMVKVMKIDKGEGHWMVLEPTSGGCHGDHLTLMIGHVGEFHYVSLHPADLHDSVSGSSDETGKNQNSNGEVSEDLTNLQLEGTETIAMFQDGHIDSGSQIPVLHLSYIAKRIISKIIIDEAAISASAWEEIYTKQMGEHEKTELVGECGNKVYIPLSFGPNLKSLFKAVLIQYFPYAASRTEKEKYSAEFILEEFGVHPGYAKVKDEISSQYLISETLGVLNHMEPPAEETKCVHGLCSRCVNFFYENVRHCLSWPGSALSWKSRERCENWPPQHVIDNILSGGCLLKPNHHKHSQEPSLEWELGFELAEKILFKDAVTADQKYCYILWRSLIIQTSNLLTGPLQLEHLRSVFLYTCERIPVGYWTSNIGACLLYMFDELLRHIKNKFLPNYFVETNNMVDHLTEKELSDVEEKIISVRYQPLVFLFQFHEACNFLCQGRNVFQMIQEDIPKFLEHKSIKKSTLETLVPVSILITREYLKAGYFDFGYDWLSQTFEERLSVSTCDDTLPYHLFIQHVLNGLDQNTIVWFSAYAEIHLKNQLPNPIVVELCGDRELIKIGDIISAECAGEFANTLVPKTFSYNIYDFCNDYAIFLRHIGKADKVISVLLFAHNKFKDYTEQSKHGDNMESQVSMVKIYSGLTCVYMEQYNERLLREFYPFMEKLVVGVHHIGAYMWLTSIYSRTGENERLVNLENIVKKRPPPTDQQDFMDTHFYKKAMEWGKHKIMVA